VSTILKTNETSRENLINLYLIHLKDRKKSSVGNVHRNLEDKVYEYIRNKIIGHEIIPGQRIIDKHVGEELGVSRSLVRQALNILAKEGLVKVIPRNGFYARIITIKDVEDIYNLRNILEIYSTKLSVPRASDEQIQEVEILFKQAGIDLKNSKVDSTVEADAKLHEMLTINSGNEELIKTIHSYNNYYIFYRVVDLVRLQRSKEAYLEHHKIFEAVKDRDAILASKLMGDHIENAKNIILKNYDSYTFN
jgi:DNA-binding GntR family transcriptional regulator